MGTLTLEPDELKKAREWWEKHKKERHNGEEPYAGAIGGAQYYKYVPTGLGEIVSAHCSLCRDDEGETLTDFTNW
jgi:hypothetical protein